MDHKEETVAGSEAPADGGAAEAVAQLCVHDGEETALESKHDDDEEEEEEDDPEGKNWNGVDQMKSMCMNCGEEGITRILIQKVPYFRELVIASFYCDHCGESNNDVTFGGEIQVQGCHYEFKCTDPRDLDRQVIKSDSCTITFKEIEFEIPAGTQKGEITTIEGMLRQASTNLMLYQVQRMEQMPEVGTKVAHVIDALNAMSQGDPAQLPFTMVIDDPAGNSFLENPHAPARDPNIKLTTFNRTKEQDEELGLRHETSQYRDAKDTNYAALLNKKHDENFVKPNVGAGAMPSGETEVGVKRDPLGSLEKDVYRFAATCPSCACQGESLTALTDIPHFKEIMIMAFTCDLCGYKNSEIKAGGAVPRQGTTVTLTVNDHKDLTRDVLKSDSAMVSIPELDLELQHGTLGGVYTTVEGLLKKINESLIDNNPFYTGDSSRLHHFTGGITGDDESASSAQPNDPRDTKTRYAEFLRRLNVICEGTEFPFTVVIRDPLGNSFISSPLGSFLPPEMDTALVSEDFTRSWQEDEDFGLNDMDTGDDDGYQGGQHVEFSDRLTHVYPKLPDHPFKFAQGGVGDSTPGGYAPAPGVVAPVSAADDFDIIVGKRQFSDDSEIEFKPYENFSGVKEGFVYRLGSKGLGYYKDVRKDEPIEWDPSVAA